MIGYTYYYNTINTIQSFNYKNMNDVYGANSKCEMRSKNMNLSLCISRVMNHITKDVIKDVINDIGLGEISHIDIINKNNNHDGYNVVFIHFKQWFDNENSSKAMERLSSGKDIKVIYDFPWFWKLTPNKSKYHF